MAYLHDAVPKVNIDHLRHNNISTSRLHPFNAFAAAHQTNHETPIILKMLVHVALCGWVLNDGRAFCEHVVSISMVTVVARIDQEANWFRCHLANETNELGGKIAVEHGLDNENPALANHEAGCRSNMVLVEHVIWQDRKY